MTARTGERVTGHHLTAPRLVNLLPSPSSRIDEPGLGRETHGHQCQEDVLLGLVELYTHRSTSIAVTKDQPFARLGYSKRCSGIQRFGVAS